MKALMIAAALFGMNWQPHGCLTRPEAESVVLIALPDLLKQTGMVCAGRLPPTSLLRRADTPFLAGYEVEADRAWPDARAAIIKLTDPAAALLLASDTARPVLTALLVPLLVGRIAPADCATLDRLVTQLAPLPPRNTAGVVVTALTYLKQQKARGRADAPDLPLCAEAVQ